MKACFLILSLFFSSCFGFSQNPVNWEIEQNIEKSSLLIHAKIDSSWHLYAVKVPNPNEGPLPTEFHFAESQHYQLIGEIQEGNPISVYDHNFGVQVSYYEKEASFEQAIKVIANNTELSLEIAYMVCNESMCIPFNDTFKIQLKN
jgi:thiol:disulfide interchange protein DsbD